MQLKRGMIVDVNLNPVVGAEEGRIRPCIVVTNDIYNAKVPIVQVVPITEWGIKKADIVTNIELLPTAGNGLTEKSIADCLQTRPIDHRYRVVKIRGAITASAMQSIDDALRIVFEL